MRLYASVEGKAHETTERLGLHRLVRQISDLQSKNTELYQRALTSEHRVSEQEAEVAALKDSVSTLNSERNELQDDLIKMRSSKVRPCLSHITIEIKVCARRCDLIITHCHAAVKSLHTALTSTNYIHDGISIVHSSSIRC